MDKYCCDKCDKEYSSKQKYAVHLTGHNNIKERIVMSCLQCKKSISILKNRINTFKYCSPSCRATYMFKGKIRPNISRKLKGKKRPNISNSLKGRQITWGNKISEALMGRKNLKLSLIMRGRKLSKEHKMRISESAKGRLSWNAGLTKLTDDRISLYANKLKGKEFNKERKENCSRGQIKLILANNGIHPNINKSIKGVFFSNKNNYEFKYDSTYELQAYKILEDLEYVKKYSRCEFCIEYIFKNSTHKYIPDIFVEYTCGGKEIIEIKPQYRLNDEVNQLKFEAAKKYCYINNLKFNVWTEKELKLRSYKIK